MSTTRTSSCSRRTTTALMPPAGGIRVPTTSFGPWVAAVVSGRIRGSSRICCDAALALRAVCGGTAAQSKCRLANARPEPDFRNRSNAHACASSGNSMRTWSCHGRYLRVCAHTPALCAARRVVTSDVEPT